MKIIGTKYSPLTVFLYGLLAVFIISVITLVTVISIAAENNTRARKEVAATQLAVIEQETSSDYNNQALTANVRYMNIMSKDVIGPNVVYTVCKFKFVFVIAAKISTGEIYSMKQVTDPDSGQPVLCSEIHPETQQ